MSDSSWYGDLGQPCLCRGSSLWHCPQATLSDMSPSPHEAQVVVSSRDSVLTSFERIPLRDSVVYGPPTPHFRKPCLTNGIWHVSVIHVFGPLEGCFRGYFQPIFREVGHSTA